MEAGNGRWEVRMVAFPPCKAAVIAVARKDKELHAGASYWVG